VRGDRISGVFDGKPEITARSVVALVVLSEDPVAVSPDRIAGLAVLATIVGGQIRHDAGLT
jgi:hypothetical protein